jgi:hypothetical protein
MHYAWALCGFGKPLTFDSGRRPGDHFTVGVVLPPALGLPAAFDSLETLPRSAQTPFLFAVSKISRAWWKIDLRFRVHTDTCKRASVYMRNSRHESLLSIAGAHECRFCEQTNARICGYVILACIYTCARLCDCTAGVQMFTDCTGILPFAIVGESERTIFGSRTCFVMGLSSRGWLSCIPVCKPNCCTFLKATFLRASCNMPRCLALSFRTSSCCCSSCASTALSLLCRHLNFSCQGKV